MAFDTWDHDLSHCENASPECKDGATLDFITKEGPHSTSRMTYMLSGVQENVSLTFSSKAMGGLLQISCNITIIVVDEATSHIHSSCKMFGCLGCICGPCFTSAVVKGTEQGLANMKRISEARNRRKTT